MIIKLLSSLYKPAITIVLDYACISLFFLGAVDNSTLARGMSAGGELSTAPSFESGIYLGGVNVFKVSWLAASLN